MESLEAAKMRIYPMGLHRRAKDAVLNMLPEDQQEKARHLLRTGEETAVIFAKISRFPGSFEEIAQSVDEEGASGFFEKWVVSVEGYGHESVGEHAVTQTAYENIASADGDEVTDNRLGSYTEFSARFKGRQTMDYFTPTIVASDPNLANKWHEIHSRLFAACDLLTTRGREWIATDEAQAAFPQLRQTYYSDEGGDQETNIMWRARLNKHAADQFKNMLPASRLTSMGVTWNSTEAEGALSKLLSHPSVSVREIGKLAREAIMQVAPTMVKYARFNPYIASLDQRRQALIKKYGLEGDMGRQPEDGNIPSSIICSSSKDLEILILAAFAFESNQTGSYVQLIKKIDSLPQEASEQMIQRIVRDDIVWHDTEHGEVTSHGVGPHDMPPRAFEIDGGMIFEMPSMTYGDWRDYKRHRMQTYVAKPLHIKWGYEIPPLAVIMDSSEDPKYHGSVTKFKEVIEEMEDLFKDVNRFNPTDARYAVTRAHFRPAIGRFNPREAFHLIRLRTGNTAHPAVRQLVWRNFDALNATYPAIAAQIEFNLRGERTQIAFP